MCKFILIGLIFILIIGCRRPIYIKKTCIENHLYFSSHVYGGENLTPILDDDGKPVKCEISVKVFELKNE